MSLVLPVLSAADPLEEAEGSIDPFSTQAGYERLAERILPFLTVRMKRARFLTSMCVSAHVCSVFGDRIAADGASPPWLVFEWYVVEAHVRAGRSLTVRDTRSFPGLTKIGRALKSGRSVGAASYLKTATIFGLHGVYRRLASGLRILTDDLTLDEGGWELLRAWEREQGLDGFCDGRTGAGAALREEMRRGVEEGLAKGHTSRPDAWRPWGLIPQHLAPSTAGTNEARLLYERLVRTDLRPSPRDPEALDMRRELVEAIRRNEPASNGLDEWTFLRALCKARGTSSALRERLDAIEAYELLCAPLNDALNLVLHLSSEQGGAPVTLDDAAAHPVGAALPHRIRKACQRVRGTALLLESMPAVQAVCERYDGQETPQQVLDACLEHHVDAQRGKPPEGKRAWFERLRGDQVLARPQYLRDSAPDGAEYFVHDYRVASVRQFLSDLRRLGR